LQKLVLGGTRNHDQENNQNLSANGMNLNNVLLREFIFGKYTSANAVAINLSACPSLEVFNTKGSNISSITIAPGSPLRELTAEGPSILLLEKMYYLTTVDMDASAIRTLDLIDIDHPKISIEGKEKVNSKTHFLDNLREKYNPVTYLLKDVDWKITQQETEIDVATQSIDILDYLLYEENSTKNGASYAVSLTGTLTIAENAYRGLSTMDLYNKYINSERFGGLDIIFEGAGYLPRIDIYNGDNKIIWTNRVQNGTLLT
jgi:hypothetical protein